MREFLRGGGGHLREYFRFRGLLLLLMLDVVDVIVDLMVTFCWHIV